MKSKLALGALALVAALLLLAEVVLPLSAEGLLAKRIADHMGTNDIQIEFSSTPRFAVALGQIDHVHIVVHQGRLGDVLVSELALDGQDVRLDMGALVRDEALAITSASDLKLTGIVTEDNLKELLTRKADKLENTEVTMDPAGVIVTANVKLFGRLADAQMTGTVLDDSGALMFHMTSLDITNAPFGKASIDNFFGDIPLVKRDKMPLGMRVTDVKMQAHKCVITATYHAQDDDVLAPYYE